MLLSKDVTISRFELEALEARIMLSGTTESAVVLPDGNRGGSGDWNQPAKLALISPAEIAERGLGDDSPSADDLFAGMPEVKLDAAPEPAPTNTDSADLPPVETTQTACAPQTAMRVESAPASEAAAVSAPDQSAPVAVPTGRADNQISQLIETLRSANGPPEQASASSSVLFLIQQLDESTIVLRFLSGAADLVIAGNAQGAVQVSGTVNGQDFDAISLSGVENLTIETAGESDRITLLLDQLANVAARQISLQSGAGDDRLILVGESAAALPLLDWNGGVGADKLLGPAGDATWFVTSQDAG